MNHHTQATDKKNTQIKRTTPLNRHRNIRLCIKVAITLLSRIIFFPFLIFIFSASYIFYLKTPTHDWYIARKTIEAIAKKPIQGFPFLSSNLNQTIQFQSEKGTTFRFTPQSFLKTEGVDLFKNRSISNLIISLRLAFLNGIAGLLSISLFLFNRSRRNRLFQKHQL